MLSIFASTGNEQSGLFYNPVVLILMVLVAVYLFLKLCTWAKKFQLSRQVKKLVYILTGLGVVGFNILYTMGNTQVHSNGNWNEATTALLASLVWVLVFAFVLMAETKAE